MSYSHLGGKENYASDRAAGARLIERAPAVPEFARLNRAFLHRAVRFAASQGISQFLDVGAGLPTQESVHEEIRSVHPDARIAYADNDPVVAAHSRALLGGNPARLVAAIRDAVAPGSYLILSHGTAHGAPPQVAARSGAASRVYDNATSRITYRDPAQISQLLDGFALAEPGLVHVSQWRPPVPVPYEFDGFLAAVGRKD